LQAEQYRRRSNLELPAGNRRHNDNGDPDYPATARLRDADATDLMTEPAKNYVPIDLQAFYRVRARRVWMITLAVAAVWVGSIVAAPLFFSTGRTGVSSPVYSFFSYICHQIPERALYISSHAMAVCSSCFGVYFGLAAGIAVYPLWRPIDEIEPIPRYWLFLSLVPITVDWSLTVFGIWENTHVSRFLTGLILSVACATFIVPALVEITRNLSARRAGKR
jgi:uncharacterized membrane protein